VNKTKTLKMKLIYIVAAVAMLAMLIPSMALPVAAQSTPEVVLTTLEGDADGGYDVAGMHVIATLMQGVETLTPTSWMLVAGPQAYGGSLVNHTTYAEVTATSGQYSIQATYNSHTYTATKKWAPIEETTFYVNDVQTNYGTSTVTWNETLKYYFSYQSITDKVTGDFPNNPDHAIQGVILNWYLFKASAPVPTAAGEATDLIDELDGLQSTYAAEYVEFMDPEADNYPGDPDSWGWDGTYMQTVTDETGASTVDFATWGEEAVVIVVIPQYPDVIQQDVTPEIATWNFGTYETESVPQVRWVGEKIVLEKNYSSDLVGSWVNFVIVTDEGGALEQFGIPPAGMNNTSNGTSVWTVVNADGVASVILTSDTPVQVGVRAALYNRMHTTVISQTSYTVYFLKFESLTLSDVVGKRYLHNAGVWTQTRNPYNEFFPASAVGEDAEADETANDTSIYDGRTIPDREDDVLVQDRNVSEDALERAQVRGWFVGINSSTREKGYLDIDGDEIADLTLPEGRWVLPDDWATLAGGLAKWKTRRIHWDINDSPYDSYVNGATPIGPFGQAVAPVVGPFTPGIEVMTTSGWLLTAVTSTDEDRMIKTVVPDDYLDAYDAPMPPAKIIFEIMEGNGFFKDALKSDVYINDANAYTNPFYYALVPAHWAIPAFISEGGYDWNTFDADEYGPYQYWEIFNRPTDNLEVATSNPAMYPTAVEVYSDNHGEAMVWLNGDWNLNLDEFTGNGGADVPEMQDVGSTIVQATADYPYIRQEPAIVSNTVEKTWYWGGVVLGVDAHVFGDGSESIATPMVLAAGTQLVIDETTGAVYPDELAYSNKLVVWVWACDRDGLQTDVLGTKVNWTIDYQTNAYISGATGNLDDYNDVTEGIFLEDGFLAGTISDDDPTDGITDVYGKLGVSYMRNPSPMEKKLFEKFWPDRYTSDSGTYSEPINFAVAAIEVYDSTPEEVTVTARLTADEYGYTYFSTGVEHYPGTVIYQSNINFGESYPIDDPIMNGDANADGVVDAADITKVERIIMGLDKGNINADANLNGSINMGDVVKIIRIMRKLD